MYSLDLGPGTKLTRTIPILDCNNDDPTCQDYYGLMPNNTSNTQEINNYIISNAAFIKIYSLDGRELYQTEKIDKFEVIDLTFKGLILISYLDKNGKVITTRKFFNQ